MKINEITDQQLGPTWDSFIIKNSSPAAFLQSWKWGQFRKQCLDEEVKYFAVCNNNTSTNTDANSAKSPCPGNEANIDECELIAAALFIKRKLPGGKFYLHCPRGPVVKFLISSSQSQIEKICKLLINKIRETAKQEKIVFARIAPPYERKNARAQECKSADFKNFSKPKILTNLKEPENTLILNLEKPEEEILQAMHQKTRYNIRLAERKGIKIEIKNLSQHKVVVSASLQKLETKDIDVFYDLLKQTAMRDKIKIFNKSYYEKLLTYFNQPQVTNCKPQVTANLFIAKYNNRPLSSIIIIGFGNTATYLHGASSNEHRNLMPNHAIQWAAIKWAKWQGYKWYDFWGIAPKFKNSDWAGISRFKRGFVSEKTGKEVDYLGTFDYVLNKKWYNLYRIGKILRL